MGRGACEAWNEVSGLSRLHTAVLPRPLLRLATSMGPPAAKPGGTELPGLSRDIPAVRTLTPAGLSSASLTTSTRRKDSPPLSAPPPTLSASLLA